MINDDKWRLSIYKKLISTQKYFQTGENLRKLNLSSLSSNKLAQIINKIISLQHHHQVYSILVNGVVLDGRNHLSNKIRNEVKSALGNTKKFEDYWSLLTLVTKMSLRQEKDYEISLIAKKSKNMSKKDTSKN